MKLKLSDHLTLPLDAATESFAILGRRGSGKTHTAVVMAEELLKAGVQVVVIDPLDVWWGLRVSKDGKTAGFPIYVAGGSHQDIPLSADAGKVLADAVVDQGLSIVLSTRHLSKTDQRRFVGEFCERLYDRKADPKHRTALHIDIDEADAFVPQRLMPGAERCFGAVDTLVRRGRSSGLAVTLISQRPQVINKDVLSQTEVLVAHQLTGPQDRKALQAWIEANDDENRSAEFMGALASLPKGRAWFWSPGLLKIFKPVDVRDRETFDSSATPKPGVAGVKPKAFAEVDLDKLTQEIAATIEKAKADDPRELRRRVAELEKQLAKSNSPKPSDEKSKSISTKPVLTDADRALLEKMAAAIERDGTALVEAGQDVSVKIEAAFEKVIAAATREASIVIAKRVDEFQRLLESKGFQKILDKLATVPATQIHPPAHTQLQRPHASRVAPGVAPATSTRPARVVSDGALPAGERTVLIAVAQHKTGVDRSQLSILTGYKKSTRNRYLQFLAAKGFVVERGETITATAEGIAALGDFEPLPTGDELRAYWLKKLPEGERAVFSVVVDGWPDAVAREAIDGITGYKKSTRNRYIQFLQARKIVTADRDGVRASEELFS